MKKIIIRNKIKKILMIEPRSPSMHIFSLAPLPRLGNIILGTILKERGFDVTVLVEEIQPIKDKIFEDADLVGISTTTSTAGRAYAMADSLRQKGIIVVMGGPHVTYMPEEAILHADYVVMGEGEEVFPALVEALAAGEKIKPMAGLVMRGEKICYTGTQHVKNLDKIPIPDFSLVKGMNIPRIFHFKKIIPVQTSRGCPFNCSFCSVTGMFGRNFRYKSVSRVLEEVERYNNKSYEIFFYDDNIAANKKWLKELLNEFISRKMKFSWSAQVRIDIAGDEELLELMAVSRCKNLFIGLESINEDTLREMNKNQTPEDIRNGMIALNKKNLPVHGMFIFGFDTDTAESIENTISFAKNIGIHTVQFLILTPFPGTKTYDDLNGQKRICFEDWSLYDGHHVTFWPKNLNPLSLQNMQIKGHREFYSMGRLIKKIVTGHFLDAAIYAYANNINNLWKKSNKFFIKSLNFISQSERLKEIINPVTS